MSFFNSLGKPPQIPMNGFQNVMQRFRQFQQMFRGDPKQQVQQLLNSGRVSKVQYNQAVQMAQQFRQMMGCK